MIESGASVASAPQLRLFVGDQEAEGARTDFSGLPRLAASFAALTGWKIAYRESDLSRFRREQTGCRNLPVEGRLILDDLAEAAISGRGAANRDHCQRLIDSLNDLLGEMHRCRDRMWRQDAELATWIPISDDGSASQKLAVLLNSLLTTAADLSGMKRAALYILDDATRNLTLRSEAGDSDGERLPPSRELAVCKADLEALLGHAILIENAEAAAYWNVPVGCRTAVCLPVSSASNLLGTLWLISDGSECPTAPETNALEVIAGRIAAELERFALLLTVRSERGRGVTELASEAPRLRPHLPNIQPPMDELTLDGGTVSADDPASAGAVYDWSICQRGRLAFLVAHASGRPEEAVVTAAKLQTAFRALAGHRSSALQLFDSVFETAMSVSLGEVAVQFLCGYFDPSSGKCELASSDRDAGAVRGRRAGRLECGQTALGEFGLAHLACLTLEPGDQLDLVIGDCATPGEVMECEAALFFEDYFEHQMEPTVRAPVDLRAEGRTLARLTIGRRGTAVV